MWNEATNIRHWNQADLAECAKQAESALLRMFPGLDERAAWSIAKAAAYQWR
jgi:hypothetical protein